MPGPGRRFGAGARFVLVQDKARALRAARHRWGGRVTTVFVEFGHHASGAESTDDLDFVVASPAELLERLGEIGLRQADRSGDRPSPGR